ncbi:TPA: O-antigen polymerase [Streptococcus pneumoniae]
MLALTIGTVVFVKKTYRTFLNPIILFVILWFIITTLSSLKLFQLFEISTHTQQIILLGTSLFVIGGGIAIWFRDKFYFKVGGNSYFTTDFEINYNLFFLLGIICLFYYLPDFFSSLVSLIRGGNLNLVRQSAQDAVDTSRLKNFIGTFIVSPSAMVLEILGVLDFWSNKKGRKLFYLSLAVIFVRVIADAGRTPLFNVVIYLLLTVLANRFSEKTEKKRKVSKIKIVNYGMLGSIILWLSTLSRTTTSVYRILYFYFAMSPILLEKWSSVLDSEKLVTKGLVSLNGFFFSISYVLKNLFRIDYSQRVLEAYTMIANTDAIWYNIAPGLTKANAYVSLFWFFYADGRLLGVLIGSLLYGTFCGYIFCRYIQQQNKKNLAMLLFIYQGVFFSFIRFPFSKSNYAIAFVLLLFFAFKKKGIEKSV